jgi:hypothetical protein
MGSLGAAQAVSGMAADDTGSKLPYTAFFNRAKNNYIIEMGVQ